MKSVLISIQPKWCELIASGEKTIEVRKTKPKIATPFKCYIYETQGQTENPWMDEDGHLVFRGCGMVIGEFICREITSTVLWRILGQTWQCAYPTEIEEKFPWLSCLTINELRQYAGSNQRIIYGWHISDLVIYDKPKELCEFEKPWYDNNGNWKDIRPCECGEICEHEYFDYSENTVACGIDYDGENCPYTKITRPPQSWCYVEDLQ